MRKEEADMIEMMHVDAETINLGRGIIVAVGIMVGGSFMVGIAALAATLLSRG